jgi:hypothetical protein
MDETIVFQDISNAKTQFESNFARAELGGIFKELVIQSTPESKKVYDDENIIRILSGACTEVADAAFKNRESDGAGFIGQTRDTVSHFASMEAEWRMEKVLQRIKSGQLDWSKEEDRLLGLEFFEDLKFRNNVLKEDYKQKIDFLRSLEEDDVVTEIAKEVGGAIAQAETKNAIISETMNVISEEKTKIQEQFKEDTEEVNEEEEEKLAPEDEDEEVEGSSDDDMQGEEEIGVDDEEGGEEDFDLLDTGDGGDEDNLLAENNSDADPNKTTPLDTITDETDSDKFAIFGDDYDDKDGDDYQEVNASLEEGASSILNKEIESVVTNEDVSDSDGVDSEEKVNEHLDGEDKGQNEALNLSNNAAESLFMIPKRDREIIFERINTLGVEAFFKKNDKKDNAKKKLTPSMKEKIVKLMVSKFGNRAKAISTLAKAKEDVKSKKDAFLNKFKGQKKKGSESIGQDILTGILSFFTGFSWVSGVVGVINVVMGILVGNPFAILIGAIDIAWTCLLTSLWIKWLENKKDKMNSIKDLLSHEIRDAISEYKKLKNEKDKKALLTIFRQDWRFVNSSMDDLLTEQEKEIKKSADYRIAETFNDDTRGGESFDESQLIFSFEGLDEEISEENDDEEISEESFNILRRQFIKTKYSNKNIGFQLYPLSPTKLDNMSLPSAKTLSNVFVKGEENVESFVRSRLEVMHDFVSRENDTDLNNKWIELKKRSEEAFDIMLVKKNKLWRAGLTPYGIIDKNDPINLLVGKNMARYLTKGSKGFENIESLDEHKMSAAGAINTIFKLIPLKKKYNRSADLSIKDRIMSIEGQLYENISWLPDDQKNQIVNVMEFIETDIGPEALEKNEFLTNISLAITDTQVRSELATNTEDDLFEKAKTKVSEFLVRELTGDETDLIRNICSNKDSVDTIPSIFEKFIVKLGKGEIDKGHELSGEGYDHIINKAKMFTALYTTVQKSKILSEEDLSDFNGYILGNIII